MLNNQGRPTQPDSESTSLAPVKTFTGHRGLQTHEALIFETGRHETTGVDIEEPENFTPRLGAHQRKTLIDLPGLSEPEAMRHYVRLSQKNYAIDAGLYPLGSCTMKHNPRLNEKMARLPGLADIHPLQPQSTVPGAIALIEDLAHWLVTITGMHSVAMSPKAGAHGEACGMMAIKAAIEARGEGDTRTVVLVPESAHGTNPATAALIGYSVRSIRADSTGTVRVADVKAALGPDVAAIMLTNPNTCGLFEKDVVEIADAVHEAGAYFYCDGANLNAIMGKVRPGDLGVDAMHINLHKTFSTPHGGGGPGAGPVVLSEALAPFAPVPFVSKIPSPRNRGEGAPKGRMRGGAAGGQEAATAPLPNPSPQGGREIMLQEHATGTQSFGRMTAFHGQMGMFVRALTYMLSHGGDGLRQASEDAVLNANYIRACLKDVMSGPFAEEPCMHEALFDDGWLKGTGVTTLDFAKAMIDEGYHPMTMYFPLVVHGAMLIEPTESESLAALDLFIMTLRDLAFRAKRGEAEAFKQAPVLAPMRRLDETRAARQPILRWSKPEPIQAQEAAE